jgi:MFS family permease
MIGDAPTAAPQSRAGSYQRDAVTWAAFGALFAFGFLNAALGPALPYIRAMEHISYLVGALHQVAYAVGGGLAGLLAARQRAGRGRAATITVGLAGAAIAAVAVGYGEAPAITIAAALVMSLLGTAALIRVWAVLADVHGSRRAVAMTEGEVSVSFAGILTPSLIGALAATTLGWRFAFVIGGATALLAALTVWRVGMPPSPRPPSDAGPSGRDDDRRRLEPTLIVVFAIVGLEFSLSFWLATYLADDVGLTASAAVAAVSGLYAANLCGRLLASRLARRASPERLLAAALATALIGAPILLAASDIAIAGTGIAIAGIGIGAMFPLTSSVHVKASRRSADSALGQVLTVAAIGQLAGPLTAGAIAQAADLRIGLLVLPALAIMASLALYYNSSRRFPTAAPAGVSSAPRCRATPGMPSR